MQKMKQDLAFRFAQYLITACMLMSACGTASAESVEQLLNRAQHRDAAAMRTLGIRMYKGGYTGIPTDRKTGLQWLNMAAEKNDDVALLFLGDIYAKGFHVPVNKRKAEDYYQRAKQYGNRNADDRLAKLGVGEGTPSRSLPKRRDAVPAVSNETQEPMELADNAAPSVAETHAAHWEGGQAEASAPAEREPQIALLSYQGAAGSMAAAAKAAGISKIAVIPFMCNGNASTPIAETVRAKLLEEMVEQPGVQCFDRAEMELVATEAGLSCPGALPENAEGVLTGEVFCAPSNKKGFVTYRLMSTADSRILAAGFKQVKWDADELDMFSGSVRDTTPVSFSLIEQDQLDALKSKALGKIQGGGIAMVYDGAQQGDNTLEARMAYAQVLAALSQTPIALYEREFFQSLAAENSLNGQTANGGAGITAVGHTKLKKSKGTANSLVVQVLGVPENNLILTTQLKQVKGSAGASSQAGNDGANGFRERLAKVAKEERSFKLVYESEVVIDEDYSLPWDPDDTYGFRGFVDSSADETTWTASRGTSARPEYLKVDAHAKLEELLRRVLRSSPDNPDAAENLMQLAALYGFSLDNRLSYVGPAILCMKEIDDTVTLVGGRSFYGNPHRNYEYGKPLKLKGMYKDGPFCYGYEYSIQWRNGLPYKVKAKIDLTPMKDKLIKKYKNDEND